MLTPILKTRTLAGLVLAYLLCALILSVALVFQNPEPVGAEMLYSHWAFSWLQAYPQLIGWVCLPVLVLMAILSRIRPGETKSNFGSANITMILIVCIAVTQFEAVFSKPHTLVGSTISIVMFLLLSSVYKKEKVLSELFHVGLLLGLSSLFVGQSIMFLVPVVFSLLILRSGNWKEWAVLFLGVIMCAVFMMLFCIWSDAPLLEFKRVIQSAWGGFFGQARLNTGHLALALALIAATASLFKSLTLGTVNERNLTLVNLTWITGVTLMVVLLGLGWQEGLILAAFPLAISVTKTIEGIERWWLADLLLLLILTAPFARNLWQF